MCKNTTGFTHVIRVTIEIVCLSDNPYFFGLVLAYLSYYFLKLQLKAYY